MNFFKPILLQKLLSQAEKSGTCIDSLSITDAVGIDRREVMNRIADCKKNIAYLDKRRFRLKSMIFLCKSIFT